MLIDTATGTRDLSSPQAVSEFVRTMFPIRSGADPEASFNIVRATAQRAPKKDAMRLRRARAWVGHMASPTRPFSVIPRDERFRVMWDAITGAKSFVAGAREIGAPIQALVEFKSIYGRREWDRVAVRLRLDNSRNILIGQDFLRANPKMETDAAASHLNVAPNVIQFIRDRNYDFPQRIGRQNLNRSAALLVLTAASHTLI